jgi:CDP-glucose 4,6-dehydratase
MFDGIYAGRRVLVTGHTGFKGSWLALWLRRMGAQVTGLALDPETGPAHWNLLGLDGVVDCRVDLRNASAVRDVLARAEPEIVFHLAAQPLVRRSYREPVDTFAINVMGLVHLFEAVRHASSVRVVVNATTDKVYAEQVRPSGYRESDPLGGHDPYSTSKACSELVTDSYRKSYFAEGPQVATARAGNVIGGGDWSEDRIVPDIVRACLSGQPLRLRHPTATRPWQHVLEPLSGYLCVARQLWNNGAADAHAWNFGPGREADLSVQALVARIHTSWPDFRVVADLGPHPHEAPLLRLDSTLSHEKLGWSPVWDAGTAIERTVAWYRAWHQDGDLRSGDDLDTFQKDAHAMGFAWAT